MKDLLHLLEGIPTVLRHSSKTSYEILVLHLEAYREPRLMVMTGPLVLDEDDHNKVRRRYELASARYETIEINIEALREEMSEDGFMTEHVLPLLPGWRTYETTYSRAAGTVIVRAGTNEMGVGHHAIRLDSCVRAYNGPPAPWADRRRVAA
ncbi:hypothetical protein WV31_10805 [Magnetospirillum sp. ME-1]|uniref:hypothetical protein n=1 Tax=Magnetospirillum sp. ME-1 TaxID=1639348 RepID=UPI000A179924|nr:hypothetical protein [Magnetospirillum sp. ME-1]ARJ66117.1 hypothetical protein WV31_10805 [Magnetospirillum sp. ME-1]